MKQKLQQAFLRFQKAIPWCIAAVTVLSANWAADALSDTFQIWLHGDAGRISPLRAAYVIFFVLMVWLLYRQRGVFLRPHTRYYLPSEEAEKRKHLVLFLSVLPKELEKSNGIPKGLQLSQDINEDIRKIEALKKANQDPRWSWEMPLRAMCHHLGRLETATVICSKKSISQVKMFLEICRSYGQLNSISFFLLAQKSGRSELIRLSSQADFGSFQGFDFESFDELSQAMWILLREYKKRGYSENETVIDITGGQKPTSVVGASMTFNRRVRTQYIQTDFPWRALTYEVIFSSSDTGNLGI